VLNLVCAMASVLGTQQSFLVAEALRDAADELENPERQPPRNADPPVDSAESGGILGQRGLVAASS
jgi:hypothetical protein